MAATIRAKMGAAAPAPQVPAPTPQAPATAPRRAAGTITPEPRYGPAQATTRAARGTRGAMRAARTIGRTAGRANLGTSAPGFSLSPAGIILSATGVGIFLYLLAHPTVVTQITSMFLGLMRDVLALVGG